MSRRIRTAESEARERGHVVVYPKPWELFLDIDDADGLATFEKNFPILEQVRNITEDGAFQFPTFEKRPSPSGDPNKWHIVVTLPRPVRDDEERILLQALLGSDRLHEMLSWKACREGDSQPTCFMEKPDR